MIDEASASGFAGDSAQPSADGTAGAERGRRRGWLGMLVGGLVLTVISCGGVPVLLFVGLSGDVPDARTAAPGTLTVEARTAEPLAVWVGREAAGAANPTDEPMPASLAELGLSIDSSAGGTPSVTPRPTAADVVRIAEETAFRRLGEIRPTSDATLTVYVQPADISSLPPGTVVAVGPDETPIAAFIGVAVCAVLAMAGVLLVILGVVLRPR
jgi:hypothetical protein